jgi:hypothetical protein
LPEGSLEDIEGQGGGSALEGQCIARRKAIGYRRQEKWECLGWNMIYSPEKRECLGDTLIARE